MDADVIVIGAGPVGSFTAWKLAQAGLRAVVIEEHPTVGEPVHCTGIIGRQVFDRFGLPRDSIMHELSGFTAYSPAGYAVTVDVDAPRAYVVERAAFDRHLAHLAAQAGASYLLAARAQRVERTRDHISVTVGANGDRRRLEAHMCIVAAGSRGRIGAEIGLRPAASYAYGVQVEAAVRDLRRVEVFCGRSLAPGSFAWVVPLGDGRARVGVRAFGAARRRLHHLLQHPALRDRIGAPISPPYGGPIPAAPSPRTYAERALSVGDAAGQVKTTTGGGVLFGLISADIAAQVTVAACRCHRFDEAFLRAYQRRWRRALAREQRLGLVARTLAGLLRDNDIDALFRCAGRRALAQRMAENADFDLHARQLLAVLRAPALLAVLKGAIE
jgi:geranylgeranyl reductase family protein